MQISLDEALEITRTGDLWIFRGSLGGGPGDPAVHQQPGQPRRDDRRPGRPAAADVARGAGPLAAGPVVRRPAPRASSCTTPGTRSPSGRPLRPARLAAPARPAGHPGDGGRRAADHRPAGRHAVPVDRPGSRPGGWPAGCRSGGTARDAALETAYCAEVVATTYQAMGLLPAGRQPNSYDPGSFWSGDDLPLTGGARLGKEIAVTVPAVRLTGRCLVARRSVASSTLGSSRAVKPGGGGNRPDVDQGERGEGRLRHQPQGRRGQDNAHRQPRSRAGRPRPQGPADRPGLAGEPHGLVLHPGRMAVRPGPEQDDQELVRGAGRRRRRVAVLAGRLARSGSPSSSPTAAAAWTSSPRTGTCPRWTRRWPRSCWSTRSTT